MLNLIIDNTKTSAVTNKKKQDTELTTTVGSKAKTAPPTKSNATKTASSTNARSTKNIQSTRMTRSTKPEANKAVPPTKPAAKNSGAKSMQPRRHFAIPSSSSSSSSSSDEVVVTKVIQAPRRPPVPIIDNTPHQDYCMSQQVDIYLEESEEEEE